METQDELRRLIRQYRERLAAGGGAALIEFILDEIAKAERKLAAMEPPQRAAMRARRKTHAD